MTNYFFGRNIIPENEPQRIAALKKYQIIGTPPENVFNYVAELATKIFYVPVSLISLVDTDKVFYKASVGMEGVTGAERVSSFCSQVILSPEVMVVKNALEDPVLSNHPDVAGGFGLQFYAGAPLITPEGFQIGTVCIVDHKAREFSDHDKGILEGLAKVAMHEIEIRRAAIEKEIQGQGMIEELASANEALAASNEELSAINEELTSTQNSLNELNDQLENQVEYRTKQVIAEKEKYYQINEHLSLAVTAANLGVWHIHPKTKGLLYNPMLAEIFGYEGKEPMTYEQAIAQVTDEYRDQILKEIENAISGGGNYDITYQQRRFNDNKVIWLRSSGKISQDEEGNYTIFSGVVRDITVQVNSRRALNEINDELSASNEELAASNEEILATNEELAKVNEELLKAENALKERESQLYFTLNAIPSQVWTANPQGALNYVNQVVCNDFGYNKEEIVGHGWQEFIHPDDLGACLKNWTRALQSGNEYVVEFRLKFSNGQYHWHLARAVPFREDGEIKLWLGTNTNIELQKQNEQKKDEFLSIASHELKTPLTSIKLYNQLINRSADEKQIKGFAAKTTDHILRLERLINDLLDVTKINAGKMTYETESFNFGKMIDDSVEIIKHQARQEIIIERNVDILYNGDHFRLEQVMNNFLSNAIKYSPNSEKIIVNAVLEHESIIVSVQDFGIGIDRDNIDRLFDRYYRVDNTAMRFEGLGLGLFISSEILKRHDGSFWIESEKGQGSTFYFRLPLEKQKTTGSPTVTDTTYKDEYLKIGFLDKAKRIEADWTGFQDVASVKAGCIAMLDMVVKTKCDRIVNDNTNVLGDWSEAAEWVGSEWFPMMEKAGVRYFAHIFSPSIFSQLAAQKSVDIMAGIITTQYFTDIALAREWIDSCPQ